jgi:hypothetical protein
VATEYRHVHERTRTNTHLVAPRRTEPQLPWQTWGCTIRYAIDRLTLVVPNVILIWLTRGHR